jgi:protease-4
LWHAYCQDVAAARELEPESIEDYPEQLHVKLAEHQGDAAAVALAARLVDHVGDRDQVRDRLIELVGEDEDSKTFRQIDYLSYLEAARKPPRKSDNVVAVIVARGTIYGGSRPPGSIGGDSTARLIRRARQNEKVKAVVLRVDSPGGSSFAAEVIRREVELTSQAGKPVIASMGSVAASGGYWISMSADEIWASPTTITGSIGIFAMLPTFQRTLAALGVHNDGVGTGVLAGTLRPERALPEEAVQAIRLMVDEGYQEFVSRVAEERDKPVEEVDRIARGRVWSGADGLRLGLVDHLGDLDAAITAAADRADLGEDYRVARIEQEPDTLSRILGFLLSRLAEALGPLPGASRLFSSSLPGIDAVFDDLRQLSGARDPKGLVAFCFCEAE